MQLVRRLIIFILVFVPAMVNGQADTITANLNRLPTNHQKIRYLYEVANKVVADQPLESEKYLRLAETLITKNDSCYFKSMIHLGLVNVFRFQGNFQEALEEADKSIVMLHNCENLRVEAELLLAKGGICFRLGKHDEAIKVLEKAEIILIQLGLDKKLSSGYNILGGVQWAKGNYPAAIKIFLKSLRIKEKIGDSIGIANVSNNIGIIYDDQKDYKNAMVWYGRALKVYRAKNENKGLRTTLNNIGVAYKNLNKFDNAITSLEESMALEKKAGNISGIGFSANNLGEVYFQKKLYPKAAVYFQRAISSLKESGEESSLPACYVNLGRVKAMLGHNMEAIRYLNDGFARALKHDNIEVQKEASLWLYKMQKERRAFSTALKSFESYHSLSDSLNGIQARKQMNELLVQYGSEKKENQIVSLKREKLLQGALLERKRVQLWISIVASSIFLLLALLLLYTYYQKRMAYKAIALKNMEVEDKNEEISSQRDEISRTNLRLTDSITYAKTIQNALLLPIEVIRNHYSDYFYLNRPKDIVSGDFVWVAFRENKMLLASVDCTGHGVPGALMSVLAISHLNQFLIEAPSFDPVWFISHMRKNIMENLNQRGNIDDSHDGLAIAIAVIDRDTLNMDFAGAGMDLLVVHKSKSAITPIKLKGNRSSIGYFSGTQDYKVSSTTLLPSDRIYLYSDGFPDQLGEMTGRKLLYSGFEKMILSSSHLSMAEQMNILEKDYNKWRGTKDQVDDMMVFGLLV